VAELAPAVVQLEVERRLTPNAIRFIVQIEAPSALPKLLAIAAAHPRIAAITLGPEDFCAALGAIPEPGALMGPNLSILHAVRLYRRHR
jgi:citrate lyase subunit beta/citryl-CoA lyase